MATIFFLVARLVMNRPGGGKALGHKEKGKDRSTSTFLSTDKKKMPNYILIVYIFLGNERAELKSVLLISYWKKSDIAATFVPVDVSIIACARVPPHRSQGRRCVF